MNVKYTEILVDGKVIQVSKVKECTPLEFIQKEKSANDNLAVLLKWLTTKINTLEKEIKTLKGEE